MTVVTDDQRPASDDRCGVPVLTIDGPSGSGKGTVGQRIAAQLGWHFLDSGALYRALAVAVLREPAVPDEAGVARLAATLDLAFEAQPDGHPARAWLGGREIGDELRGEDCAREASRLAAIPAVRRALLQRQRDFRRPPGLVADGRDMGTTVFPGAIVKVYLTASDEVRALRRYNQLKEKGFDVSLEKLLGEIRERDARDARRGASPLRPAEDAEVLDTSSLTIDQAVETILARLRRRFAERGLRIS